VTERSDLEDDMLDDYVPDEPLVEPDKPKSQPTYEVAVEALESINKDGAIAIGRLIDPGNRNQPFRQVRVRIDARKARELAETFATAGHSAGPLKVTLDKFVSIGRLER